jgi:hypothetical protein
MRQRSLDEVQFSSLHRCLGRRLNVFRAMHTPGLFLNKRRSVLALREGSYALTARIAFDLACGYFYVRSCHWYRSDLCRIGDAELPEVVRQDLLRRFLALLG